MFLVNPLQGCSSLGTLYSFLSHCSMEQLPHVYTLNLTLAVQEPQGGKSQCRKGKNGTFQDVKAVPRPELSEEIVPVHNCVKSLSPACCQLSLLFLATTLGLHRQEADYKYSLPNHIPSHLPGHIALFGKCQEFSSITEVKLDASYESQTNT